MECDPEVKRVDHDHISTLRPEISTKFRFKRKHTELGKIPESLRSAYPRHRSSHRHERHHQKQRRSHQARASSDKPENHDDDHLPNTSSGTYLDPDTAFRESLFDALADDEGAAFWEGVYGQPIHTYSAYRHDSNASTGSVGDGELQRMSDGEYTAYVRAKMWEKSHEYVLEERAKRERERAARRDATTQEARRRRYQDAWENKIDEVFGRRKAEKPGDEWSAVWERYTRNWEKLRLLTGSATPSARLDKVATKSRALLRLPWPVKSGRARDIGKESVELFIRNAPSGSTPEGLLEILKAERIRWHPDKIQHRFRAIAAEENTMKDVTAVFQMLDQMWSDTRQAQASS